MKKILFSFFLVLIFIISVNTITSFASSNYKNKEINFYKDGENAIIQMPDYGIYYEIKYFEEIIYKGTDKEIIVPLKENVNNFYVNVYKEKGDIQNFQLKIKNDPNKKSMIKDQYENIDILANTKNDPQELKMINSIENNSLETVVSQNSISLQWSNFPSDYMYEIYKNGELIKTTDLKNYTDNNVKTGETYTYEVLAKLNMTEPYKHDLELKLMDLNLTPEEIKKKLIIQGSLNTIIEIPKPSTFKLPGTSDWKNYIIRYQTFIPDFSVKNPAPLSKNKYFKGDNRSFDFWSDKYRTRADVESVMTDGNSIKLNKKVGQSVACEDKNCKTITEKKTASSSGISMQVGINTVSKKTWNVRHDVGIPFSSVYPNINYYYDGEITSKGTLYINGAHDRAPSHELYIAPISSGNVLTLYKFTNEGFGYLVPGTPQKHFRITY